MASIFFIAWLLIGCANPNRSIWIAVAIGNRETPVLAEPALRHADSDRRLTTLVFADFEQSQMIDQENASAPKWQSLQDAEAAMVEADAILADVVAGNRPVPTVDELLTELPALEVR